jgi:DNA-binding GntR family transcriptional regulator
MTAVESQSDMDRKGRGEYTYLRLRELIVHGLLAPGSRIIETEVAERLGVSRTPIRSALQLLQQEGFVVGSRSGERARMAVSPLTRSDAMELFELVGVLEGLSAARVARLAPDVRGDLGDQLWAANEALAALGQGSAPPDRTRYFDLDAGFHQIYVDAGAGGRLAHLHASVKPQAERYTRLYVNALTGEIGTSVREHQKIIEAIRIGAPAQAQDAVLENWRNAAQRLNRIIDTVGERGSW